MRLLYLLVFVFVISANAAAQQKEPLLSGTFDSTRVVDFLHNLEAQSPYFFYYDSAQLDSFRITLSVQQQPLRALLDAAFKNTDIHYALDVQQVFITRQLQVLTTLPAGFNEEDKNGIVKTDTTKALLSSAAEKRSVIKTTSQN
jgi:hypothetical protein